MKVLKYLIFSLVLILIGTMCCFRVPLAQKYIVTRWLRDHFAEVSIDKISIGFKHAKIEKVFLSNGTLEIRAANIDAKFSLIDCLCLKEFRITDLSASGVFVSLNSQKSDSSNQKISEILPIGGIDYGNIKNHALAIGKVFHSLQDKNFPFKAIIDHARLEILADIYEYVLVDIVIDGGGLAPMSTAIFNITATTDVDCIQPLNFNANATLQISQDQASVIKDAHLNGNCVISNQANGVSQEFGIALDSQKENDRYLCDFSIHRMADKLNNKGYHAHVILDNLQKKIFIRYNQNFDSQAFDELLIDGKFPTLIVDAEVSGEFELVNWSGLLKSYGMIKLSNEYIQKIFPSLRSDLLILTDGVIRMHNGTLSLTAFDGRVTSSGEEIKLSCHLVNPIPLWDKTLYGIFTKNIYNFRQALVRISVEQFDPKFVLAKTSPVKVIGCVSGEFDISSEDERFFIKSRESNPLRIKNFSAEKGYRKLLHGVDVTGNLHASWKKDSSSTVDLSNVTLSVPICERAVTGDLRCIYSPDNAQTNLELYVVCDLRGLCQLSSFAKHLDVQSGIISGSINYSKTGDEVKISSDGKLKSFVSSPGYGHLQGSTSIDVVRTADNSQTSITLEMVGKEKTSVNAEIGVMKNASSGGMNSKVEIAADAICLEDIKELAQIPLGFFGKSKSKLLFLIKHLCDDGISDVNTSPLQTYNERSSIARWARYGGTVLLNIGKLFISDDLSIDDVKAFCVVSNDAIDLKALDFYISGCPFSIDSRLEFVKSKASTPYNLSLSGFGSLKDLASLSKLFSPDGSVAMEGTGKVTAKIFSSGNTLMEVVNTANGSVSLELQNGVIRPPSFLKKKDRVIFESIESVSGLLAAKRDKFEQISHLMRELNCISYDTIAVRLARGNNLNLIFDQCHISGPEIYAEANGGIFHMKNRNFWQFPMFIDVKLYARGRLGTALEDLNLIIDRPKTSKYMTGPTFLIKGTLSDPDWSDMTKMLYLIL